MFCALHRLVIPSILVSHDAPYYDENEVESMSFNQSAYGSADTANAYPCDYTNTTSSPNQTAFVSANGLMNDYARSVLARYDQISYDIDTLPCGCGGSFYRCPVNMCCPYRRCACQSYDPRNCWAEWWNRYLSSRRCDCDNSYSNRRCDCDNSYSSRRCDCDNSYSNRRCDCDNSYSNRRCDYDNGDSNRRCDFRSNGQSCCSWDCSCCHTLSYLNAISDPSQNVAPNAAVLFAANRVDSCGNCNSCNNCNNCNNCNSCCIQHSAGTANFNLNCPGVYLVNYNANVCANDDCPFAAALALISGGVVIPGSQSSATILPSARCVSLSASALITVPCGTTTSISLANISPKKVEVTNANLVITKLS